jgi:hypothetical protein
MGTWGTGPFDDESDWAWELQEAHDWSVVDVALQGAADVGAAAYLQAPDGQVAWAAAAVVAASDDPSALSLPDEVTEWLDHHREARPPATVNLRGELFTECSPTTRSSWNSGRKPGSLARPEPRP